MKTENPCLASTATALPSCAVTQQEAEKFITRHYESSLTPAGMKVVRKVFRHPSVKSRRFAFENPETVLDENPDSRAERFISRSVELSALAAGGALEKSGLAPEDVSALVVNTCTGYACPGVSTYLIEKLGLRRNVWAFDLVGSGCGGAIPNMQAAGALLRGFTGGAVLSVSVEICSCTFQMADDLSLIISNAIFGDGAAAAVLWDRPEGLELLGSASRYFPEHREDLRFVYRNGRLHNQLSLRIPGLVAEAAALVVGDLLASSGLGKKDVRHWILHSGGENVINSVKEKIGLSEEQLAHTRRVLSDLGNMSSATVWFVLEEALKAGIGSGDRVVMLAFGAGLSAHAYLLRKK